MRQVAIYMLTDPTGAQTNYVGRSVCPEKRMYEHMHDISGYSRNPKSKWIKMLLRRGLKPILTVLITVPEHESRQAEADAISMSKAIRGLDCLNVLVRSGV